MSDSLLTPARVQFTSRPTKLCWLYIHAIRKESPRFPPSACSGLEQTRTRPQAKMAVFYSFGEGGEGGQYYDSHIIEIPHGAPLRLRAENELGFKMVKWIQAIEFVENVKPIYKGEGGYAEDHEFFGSMANI